MKFFCTDGIRGRAIDLICSNIVVKLGQILGEKSKKILIGYDTRVSSPQIVNLLVNGIVTKSCNVDIVHVVSTPMISFFLMNYKYDYGIMVTASHNPYFDNGIKIFNSSGEKIDQLEIDDIKEKFNRMRKEQKRELDTPKTEEKVVTAAENGEAPKKKKNIIVEVNSER